MRVERMSRAVFLGVVLLLNGCASVVVWEDDEPYEVQQGEEKHKAILARTPAYDDEKLARYVSAIGNKIAAVSDRPSLKWHFTVLDSPIENAFATMGGYVYITRGLLAYLRNESDLAAVLAHEVAHICRRDAIRANRREGIAVLGMVLALPEVLLVPQIGFAPLGMGMSAVRRSDEVAADEAGATYLARSGYGTDAMHDVLDVIEHIDKYKKSRGQPDATWWHRVLADHPSNEKRQERLAKRVDSAESGVGGVSSSNYLAVIDGLEIGNSVYEGIAYKGKRYFPDWEASVQVPEGWWAYAAKGEGTQLPKLWIVSWKRDARLLVERRAVFDGTKRACDAIADYFDDLTLSDVVSHSSGNVDACVAVGSKSVSALFSAPKTHTERVGIVRLNQNQYLSFRGVIFTKDGNRSSLLQEELSAIGRSIEPFPAKAVPPARPRLRIYSVRRGESFEKLGRAAPIATDGAGFLRAINVRSADAEVTPGETVKIVK